MISQATKCNDTRVSGWMLQIVSTLNETALNSLNPTNGSWWMVQILSTTNSTPPHKTSYSALHEPHTVQKPHLGLSTSLLPLFSHPSQTPVFSFKRVLIEGFNSRGLRASRVSPLGVPTAS